MGKLDKLVGQAREHMDTGEEVIVSILGTYETEIMGTDSVRTGVFVATNNRLLFYAKKVFGYDLEVFPFSNISSIEAGKNMMGRHVTVYASGNKAKMKWIKAGDVDAFVTHVRNRIGKKEVVAPAPVVQESPRERIADQIRELALLHQDGLLTDAEFSAKKAELLARL